MRVTNTMMRNNSLLNMQKNKAVYNKHLTEYNTQKKIQRPSDNPTIAVRALKYRTTLSEIGQYLTNIKDATSWMDATSEQIRDMNRRVEDMAEYCTQAATGTLNAENRKDVLAQLREFADYIYEQDANADYAGRYLFTGYRTDTPLLFDKIEKDEIYTITENLEIDKIRRFDYVYGQAVYSDTKTADDYALEASKFQTTHRTMVSYHDIDGVPKDASGNPITDPAVLAGLHYIAPTLTYRDKNGTVLQNYTIQIKSVTDDTDYNEHLNPGANEVYLIQETGELVFGDNVYDDIRGRKGGTLSVVYQKTNFEKNDVRPQHYFKCETYNKATNLSYVYGNAGSQDLNYQVNFSQSLTVNTEACNAIDLSVGRKIDDIANLCDELDIMEANLTKVKKRIEDCDQGNTAKLAALNELRDQIENQIALQKKVLGDSIAAGITVCHDAQDKLNVAEADHAARYNRLQMTESKLGVQQMDTEEAKSENEDAELGETYINFTEADLLYQATLNATSKVLGQSLLNFI